MKFVWTPKYFPKDLTKPLDVEALQQHVEEALEMREAQETSLVGEAQA